MYLHFYLLRFCHVQRFVSGRRSSVLSRASFLYFRNVSIVAVPFARSMYRVRLRLFALLGCFGGLLVVFIASVGFSVQGWFSVLVHRSVKVYLAVNVGAGQDRGQVPRRVGRAILTSYRRGHHRVLFLVEAGRYNYRLLHEGAITLVVVTRSRHVVGHFRRTLAYLQVLFGLFGGRFYLLFP